MKLALTVGINDYPGTGADLAGCVNDARDWAAALSHRGFSVVTMLDAQATKTAVLNALLGFARTLRRGDRLVFTFSGHGTWVADRDGDEPDRRDEALCLHDFRTGGLLLDDELATVTAALAPGVRLTVVSDSCHSGTVSRLASAPSGLAVARFLPPGLFLAGAALSRAEAAQRAPRVVSASRPGAILLSGCADHELSYDAWFGARPNGAFTRAALDALAPPGTRQTYRGWHKALARLVDVDAYPQHPQLTASTYQRYLQALA